MGPTLSRISQVPRRDARVLRERDVRLFNFRVPPLLPLEAVEPAVADLRERRDLPFHGHVTRSGEDVAPVVAGGDGILEMGVPDVASQLPHGVLRLLLARYEGVMRVPEQRHIR